MSQLRGSALLRAGTLVALAGLLSLGLAGCVTVGASFEQNAVDALKPGITTMAEVRAQLGDPVLVGVDKGLRQWTYLDYRATIFGGFRGHHLVITFDNRGRIDSFSYLTSEPQPALSS